MTAPCVQGERLASLETIIEQNSATMSDMKEISRKTYEVLSVISEQGAQLRELRAAQLKNTGDLREAFIRERALETLTQEHTHFITEHKASTTRFYQFTLPLIGTITAAAIITATAFAISMADQHNYTVKQSAAQSTGGAP